MRKGLSAIKTKFKAAGSKLKHIACDCRGDLATNTIGGIIVAVVIIGLLVTAIDAFFPTFFADMFQSMETPVFAR